MQAFLIVSQGPNLLRRLLHIVPKTCHRTNRLTALDNSSWLQTRYSTLHILVPLGCYAATRFNDMHLSPLRYLSVSPTKCFQTSSSTRTNDKERANENEEPEFKRFYRLPSIVGLRILSRVKIAQTCLTLAILPPLFYYHDAGIVTAWQLQFSIGAATFALFMLYAMSFFLRRVIGAMYLNRDGSLLKVSHLTFWGGRRDTVLPVMDVIPLSEGSNKPDEILMKLERYTTNDILYFTLRFGRIIDTETFESVFGRP